MKVKIHTTEKKHTSKFETAEGVNTSNNPYFGKLSIDIKNITSIDDLKKITELLTKVFIESEDSSPNPFNQFLTTD